MAVFQSLDLLLPLVGKHNSSFKLVVKPTKCVERCRPSPKGTQYKVLQMDFGHSFYSRTVMTYRIKALYKHSGFASSVPSSVPQSNSVNCHEQFNSNH